jgi:hypothetical protein
MRYCEDVNDQEIHDNIILANGLSWVTSSKHARGEEVHAIVDKECEA